MSFASQLRWIPPTALLAAALAFAGVLAPAHGFAQTRDDSPHGGSADAPTSEPVAPATSPAVEPSYLFHRPDLEYGSAARFSPLSVLFDRGFSTLLWDSAERHPHRIAWAQGWSNVWDALVHPMSAIKRDGGMRVVLRREFVPENWDVWEWAFMANYMGHMLAGGQTYRALAEWYDENGVPLPAVAGAATVMGTILVNEAIESIGWSGGPSSTVFDVYVFEPIGIALFSFDGVARFFAHNLHAQDWSPQAALTFPGGQLQNGAQMISYHVGLPWIERLDLLSITGQGTQTGLLWDLDSEHSLGAAVGFASKNRLVDELGRERLEARASAGLYLSRRGSLLASLNLFRGMENLAALNLYPGSVGGLFREVGAWALLRRGGTVSVGLTAGPVPGIGLGYDFRRARDGSQP